MPEITDSRTNRDQDYYMSEEIQDDGPKWRENIENFDFERPICLKCDNSASNIQEVHRNSRGEPIFFHCTCGFEAWNRAYLNSEVPDYIRKLRAEKKKVVLCEDCGTEIIVNLYSAVQFCRDCIVKHQQRSRGGRLKARKGR